MTGMTERVKKLVPRIEALRASGLSDAEIGRQLGYYHGGQIGKIVGLRGNQPSSRSPEFIAEARKCWERGLSTAAIGKELGVTKNVIVGVAHRNGFPPRPSPLKG